MSIYTDVTIIGAGPVGLFGIFQAGMLEMRCHVIDSLSVCGGQCATLYPEKPIYDIPGHPKITGRELIDRLLEQAAPFKPEYHLGQQVKTLEIGEEYLTITTTASKVIHSKIVIIAAGNGAFTPHIPDLADIQIYENNSVFYDVKDPHFFRDQKVVIAGGGDSAVDWAINLVDIASKVYLVHRREQFRCLPQSSNKIQSLASEGRIELLIPRQLHALQGEQGKLNAITLRDLEDKLSIVEADYLLAFFGLKMNLGALTQWALELDRDHIIVDQSTSQTNIPNIYAVGDVATYPGKLKLILTGFSEISMALHHAYSRVFNGEKLRFKHSTTKGIPA